MILDETVREGPGSSKTSKLIGQTFVHFQVLQCPFVSMDSILQHHIQDEVSQVMCEVFS